MILHQPYGFDDPYSPLPTERYPRDPQPGDTVYINFEAPADADSAWLMLEVNGVATSVPALPLAGNTWTANLGRVATGRYEYRIGAAVSDQEILTAPFAFEVARWFTASRLQDVRIEPRAVTLILSAPQREKTAALTLSFPLSGVCRTVFATGAPQSEPGLPCVARQQDNRLTVTCAGIEVVIDKETLELTARRPGQREPALQASLRTRWLEDSRGLVTRLTSSFRTLPGEHLYGLGERFIGPSLLGHRLDVRVFEEYKEQGARTYLPVPLLVSNRGYGLWLTAAEPSVFDLTGEVHTVTLAKLPTSEATLPLTILLAEEPYGVTSSFCKLTGEMRVPPKWAFGPWMSANTWNSQALAERAVQRTLQEDVPATALVIEAWSDEATFYIFNDAAYAPKSGGEAPALQDFTFGGRWPDPKAFIDRCHTDGIHVLLWQIPVQKQLDEPHHQHDADEAHMLQRGFHLKESDGSPYRSKGWWFRGGLVLDFSNPEACEWWFSKRRYLFADLGIDGMKTDGGEHLWGRDLQAHDGKRGLELFNTYPNQYVGAYHSFIQDETGGRGLTFSRAGYTGAQMWPGHWAGDENSTWSAYRASILAGLSAGLSGITVWGWDIGGFSGDVPTVELYLRSAQMACFCPLMQYHSELHGAAENRDRSPWNVAERHGDRRALDIFRFYAKLRLRLMGAIYDDATFLSADGRPLMRYPALEYPDAHDFLSQDPFAYLFGRDLIVLPVVEKGAVTREARLPPGGWVDFWSGSRLDGLQRLNVPAPLERIPVFIRDGSPRLEQLLAIAAVPV